MDLVELADRITNKYLANLKIPEIVKWFIAPEVSFKVLKILLSYYHKVRDGKEMKNYINLKEIVKKEIKKIKPTLEKLATMQPFYGKLIEEAKKTNQPYILIEFFEKYKNSSPKKIKTLFQDIENVL